MLCVNRVSELVRSLAAPLACLLVVCCCPLALLWAAFLPLSSLGPASASLFISLLPLSPFRCCCLRLLLLLLSSVYFPVMCLSFGCLCWVRRRRSSSSSIFSNTCASCRFWQAEMIIGQLKKKRRRRTTTTRAQEMQFDIDEQRQHRQQYQQKRTAAVKSRKQSDGREQVF